MALTRGAAGDLQHLRQVRAPSAALIIHIVSRLFRAVGGDLVQPVDDLRIAATLIDQTLDVIATTAP
jgi:hypothetical protein